MTSPAQIDLFGLEPPQGIMVRRLSRQSRKNLQKNQGEHVETQRFSYSITDCQLIVTDRLTGAKHHHTLRGVILQTVKANIQSRLHATLLSKRRDYLPGLFFRSFMTEKELADEYKIMKDSS